MENLILNRGGRKPVFKDLKIRPTLASGKGTGQLEVHTNGFRYIYNSKDTVDIVFKVTNRII
jgi:nucleosome binding factor SPN SPT16 subunit